MCDTGFCDDPADDEYESSFEDPGHMSAFEDPDWPRDQAIAWAMETNR